MMVRTQIMLEPEAHSRAKQRAAELGIPLAAYIRRLVDADTGQAPRVVDRSAIIGMFNSGGSDIARHKKEMIADAFAAELVASSRRDKKRASG